MIRTLLVVTAIALLSSAGLAQQDTTNQRLNGKRDGYWIKRRCNGAPKWEGHFNMGERNGYWKFFDKGGLHSEGNLLNGQRIGAWYLVNTASGTRLDMTRWDGKGHCVGGATLSW